MSGLMNQPSYRGNMAGHIHICLEKIYTLDNLEEKNPEKEIHTAIKKMVLFVKTTKKMQT